MTAFNIFLHLPVHFSYCIFTCVVDMDYLVYFNIFCCFLLPLVAMFVIYGHIFLTVRHQIRRIAVVRATREDKTASGTASTEIEKTETSAAGGSRGLVLQLPLLVPHADSKKQAQKQKM